MWKCERTKKKKSSRTQSLVEKNPNDDAANCGEAGEDEDGTRGYGEGDERQEEIRRVTGEGGGPCQKRGFSR